MHSRKKKPTAITQYNSHLKTTVANFSRWKSQVADLKVTVLMSLRKQKDNLFI